MLVLTRFVDQRIMIGDDIVLTVVEVRRGPDGGKVRIGIEAPREIAVHREEVYDEIRRLKLALAAESLAAEAAR